MSFSNKKILFLCKETYSYPLYFLASKLQYKNEVAAFFFMPAECVYNKSYLNANTYYKFMELDNVKIFDVRDISDRFTNNIDNPIIDYEYMDYIEENYTHFKNLNLQLMSSQLTTRYYHNRFYFNNYTKEQIIQYRRVLKGGPP